MGRLEEWEALIDEYEAQSSEKVTSSVRTAVLIQNSPAQIREYLQVKLNAADSYDTVRGDIIAYHQARRTWTDTPGPAAGGQQHQHPVPMDI
eukprot:15476303-Alexandrium_andersonii.AAC.1